MTRSFAKGFWRARENKFHPRPDAPRAELCRAEAMPEHEPQRLADII
jgi:hypothetical protein